MQVCLITVCEKVQRRDLLRESLAHETSWNQNGGTAHAPETKRLAVCLLVDGIISLRNARSTDVPSISSFGDKPLRSGPSTSKHV